MTYGSASFQPPSDPSGIMIRISRAIAAIAVAVALFASGAAHAEMQLVRRALGDVPLIGFFAGGEIAYRNLYGYTGVLTVFTGGEE